MNPQKISLFRFLLEGHAGVATLSTVEAKQGLVKTLVPVSRLPEFWPLMTDISGTLKS
ncbi:MAG TPA: DUF4911 domain-containing protein [Desulfobulbaceae bacterium]|nr:DUF4911 domain-containing protein [Desulfobulbaceae bacterium]